MLLHRYVRSNQDIHHVVQESYSIEPNLEATIAVITKCFCT